MNERSFSLMMLMAIAIFALIALMIPGKPALRADTHANDTVGNQTHEATVDTPTYSIPLTTEIRLPLATTVSFKVRLVDGEILHGSLLESSGTCFTFFVMDEDAFLDHSKYGPSSLAKTQGEVYVSATPVHHMTEFVIDSDRTGDYYFVLTNPVGTCHGKIVSIALEYQTDRLND